MSQKIRVPRIEMVDAQIFEALQVNGVETALAACIEAKHRPLYMPALADARIAETNKDSPLFMNWFTTPSVCVTGKSESGSKVVVFAHVPTYFADPVNIKKAREKGLRNGAGIMPKSDFYELLKREDGKTVFVVDYDKLRKAKSGVISVRDALSHPQTVPFLGGQERAEQYLTKYVQVYGQRILFRHSDDLDERPRGRLLFICGGGSGGLSGGNGLDNLLGRFCGVGVAEPREEDVVRGAHGEESAYRVPGAVVGPRLEDLLEIAQQYVSPVGMAAFEAAIRAKYE